MTEVSLRIEDDIKANAEQALKEMGLNMSTAITMFLIKVGRERRIPFEITADDPFYSSENMKRLRRSAAQMEQTGGTIHEIGTVEDDDQGIFR
ncbi:MAG: type II toxin-antitoxin system RelB/DinJ family antitoxin [Firmicutes bacterium]|nr:type II toxin-antitoxin system RelB/DinJ family antitoxin [Bacillota bacterium]